MRIAMFVSWVILEVCGLEFDLNEAPRGVLPCALLIFTILAVGAHLRPSQNLVNPDGLSRGDHLVAPKCLIQDQAGF